jgi:DNA-binding transcriptional MerR regulator
MANVHYAIKTAARHTGLSAHVIRVWEKRYGAVSPERTGTNRRLYPADQIARLNLLRDLTQAGHSIGQVAKPPNYQGASLPAVEIARAARQNRARAVALSLVHPENDPRLEGELTRLRELLPVEVSLLVGGRAMPAYCGALEKIGALQIKDPPHSSSILDELRQPAKKASR